MSKFKFQIDPLSSQLKFQQLVDSVIDAISENRLQIGDILPSVNQLVKESSLSRDTVFKAYAELKNRGIVESVPNKGYFIAKATTKVFLFLDTFKAYKEVLYGSFLDNLPENFSVDLHFHHYNIDIFEKIITENIGRYTKYIVMNFDHERVPEIIKQIPPSKLLVIDWEVHTVPEASTIYQDFGQSLYDALCSGLDLIKKYRRFVYLYPEFTYHPVESIVYFEKFCKDNFIPYEILKNSKKLDVKAGDLYLMVSDRTLSRFLDQCADRNLIIGQDAGVISYNETPMKKYVKDGISVISTDFELMGKKAAEIVTSGESIHLKIDTHLKVRASM
ncbi:GntR family transcriptional regulator [Mangrovibacterium diazotrophicum]|uniref:DNA-binding transcriptional regulator YhcF (GntR family) n=1 Tax=Mangrovibacterium diazotrophicum TaxID=1261403 RepID=A0A419VV55_9BACT|nr:GntR family transcriptional regulator [Mangrovibacterium diazotrophicum]RKD86013.1 DNA-binding transcriptional regulator YhcF (GntR family) [Mangrovibacterium diazotrophicum]